MRLSVAQLREREQAAAAQLRECRLCGHDCRTDRTRPDKHTVCRLDDAAHVAGWGLHLGEEPELVGRTGSGLVLLGGCNLACRGCETAAFSLRREGVRRTGAPQLAGILLELERRGAATVQLVTPTPQLPVIVSALRRAAERGFARPVVWNCGGYESAAALALLDGIVDVYLPDLKHGTDEAGRLAGPADYAAVARDCLTRMHAQVGNLTTAPDGTAVRGLLVRVLVLPADAAASGPAVRFLAGLSADLYVNVMSQYQPVHRLERHAALGRRVTADEVREVLQRARAAGLRQVRLDGRPAPL